MIHVQSDDDSVIPHRIRKEMTSPLADGLRRLLADTITFYLRAHGYHWNVTGPDFAQYHALFETIYSDVYDSVDPIAENIRKLGSVAPFRLVDLISLRSLSDDVSSTTDALDMAANLAGANKQMIAALNATFQMATNANEQGIANFLAERIDQHQKWDWQLTVSVS